MTKTRLFLCAIAGFALAIPVAALANPATEQYGNPITQAGPPTTSTSITPSLVTPSAVSTATTTTTTTTTPTTTQTTTTTPTTTTSTTPEKVLPSKASSGPPPGPPPSPAPTTTLPFTGQNLGFAAAAGLLLLALGFGLRRFGRKRTG